MVDKKLKAKTAKLPESELEIMLAVWNGDGPVSSAFVSKQVEDRGWADTTVLNFLSRLVDRGFLKREKQGKSNLYTPIISREEYTKGESRSFLRKLYDNSVKDMVASLYREEIIDDEDLEEIRRFIEEKSAASKEDV